MVRPKLVTLRPEAQCATVFDLMIDASKKRVALTIDAKVLLKMRFRCMANECSLSEAVESYMREYTETPTRAQEDSERAPWDLPKTKRKGKRVGK